jgi:hypothetical protein
MVPVTTKNKASLYTTFPMKKAIYLLPLLFFACRNTDTGTAQNNELDSLAKQYVTLGLTIGKYDPDFVDAYYGPDSLRPLTPPSAIFPKDSLLKAVASLQGGLEKARQQQDSDTLKNRATWMMGQLTAFARRIRIFSGETAPFDEETKDLFGVTAPVYEEAHFQQLLLRLDSLLPGKGDVSVRFQQLANRFIIPKNKLDTVFKTAIAECRKRTLAHYSLPANEDFRLEFVTGKPWSGYNWYKGNYQSLIQVNTDMQIFIDRVIDVGSHESYPGHHVYNMLLEKNLYAGKGWVEISLYPLFSPQSLIAEGSANYGIDVVFPGNDRTVFAAGTLLPLAGLDTSGISLYFKVLAIRGQLNYARNEVARGILNGTMNESTAMQWLMKYGLFNRETAVKSIDFIRHYRSYVINYNYGQDLVKQFVQSTPGSPWDAFGWLLSHQVSPAGLEAGKKK